MKKNRLTLGRGKELIKNVNYLGLKTIDISWDDLLRHYCLEEGTAYYINDGTIHFYKKEAEPEPGSSKVR